MLRVRRIGGHLRPRRLRLHGVGNGKSGTTSLTRMFGAYRAAHEIDRNRMHALAASVLRGELDVGSAPAGAGSRQVPDRGSRWMNMWNLNAITPETEKTAHYFFAQAFNFKLDQKWVADMLAVQIRDIFLEDMAMVKAQQINMDLGPSPVVHLGQDKAWVAMRQIVDRVVKEEQQPAKAA